MQRWPGFGFSVARMKALVAAGWALLEQFGQADSRGCRCVYLKSRRPQRYGYVLTTEWGSGDADPSVGLFFWGCCRLRRIPARLPDWDWQTPCHPRAVRPENFPGDAIRRVTDGEIAIVLRFLRRAQVISPREFTLATGGLGVT